MQYQAESTNENFILFTPKDKILHILTGSINMIEGRQI